MLSSFHQPDGFCRSPGSIRLIEKDPDFHTDRLASGMMKFQAAVKFHLQYPTSSLSMGPNLRDEKRIGGGGSSTLRISRPHVCLWMMRCEPWTHENHSGSSGLHQYTQQVKLLRPGFYQERLMRSSSRRYFQHVVIDAPYKSAKISEMA